MKVWALDRNSFKKLLSEAAFARRERFAAALGKVPRPVIGLPSRARCASRKPLEGDDAVERNAYTLSQVASGESRCGQECVKNKTKKTPKIYEIK